MLTDKQESVLSMAYDEGAVWNRAVAPKIYNHESSASEALNKLADRGFLDKERAGSEHSGNHVYFLTEKGEQYLNMVDM